MIRLVIIALATALAGPALAASCELSLAKYSALQTGMSIAEAEAILGCPGEEMSRSDMAGYTTIMLMWQGGLMQNMNAIFQNDELVTKAQFGLR